MIDLDKGFIAQNPLCANLPWEFIDCYAEHHSGGLIVLGVAMQDDTLYMKMHDDWGPDDDNVVVHIYDTDDIFDADGEATRDKRDLVFHFKTGEHAMAFFEWAMEAISVEVFR